MLIKKGVAFLCANSDIAMTVLRLLAECGRVSRRTFDLLPYSYRNTCVYIKKLVDDKCVGLSGVGNAKSYVLLSDGRKVLSASNPQRYTPELFEFTKLLARHPDRSRLRGDVAAMMSLAGFAVHTDDKPALPAHIPLPPDFQYTGLRHLFHNTQPQAYGRIIPDRAPQSRRLTPINCYYDAILLKSMREHSADKGINYSRACGALVTPSFLFRVYHSRDVAMRFQKTGEDNLSTLLRTAFTGYLPQEQSGILVFGWDFTSAHSILKNYLSEKAIPPPRSGEIAGEILSPSNLGNPLFYLPICREALELLRLMCFPDWRKSLMYYVSVTHAGLEQTNWSYQHEDRRVCIAADLNLINLAILLRGIAKYPQEPITIICLPWQQDFILALIKEYGGRQPDIELALLHDSFLGDLIDKHLKPHWG